MKYLEVVSETHSVDMDSSDDDDLRVRTTTTVYRNKRGKEYTVTMLYTHKAALDFIERIADEFGIE